MMSVHSKDSYYEEFKRHFSNEGKKKSPKKSTTNALLTDRSAYISFLEIQLERVTASVMTVQGFSERIKELQDQYVGLEERVQSLARALKVSQSMGEQNERIVQSEQDSLETRVHDMGRAVTRLQNDCKLLSADIPGLDNQVGALVAIQMKDLTDRYTGIERKMMKLVEDRLGGCTDVYSALERRFMGLLDKHTADLQDQYTDAERRIREKMEAEFSDKIDSQRKFFRDELRSDFDVKICEIAKRLESFENRSESESKKSDSRSEEITKGLRDDIERTVREKIREMENTHKENRNESEKNRHVELSKIAEEIATIRGKVNSNQDQTVELVQSTVTTAITALRDTMENERTEVRQRAWNAEQTCTRLGEDLCQRMESVKSSLFNELRSMEEDIRGEVTGGATSVHQFQKGMRDEFKRREKTMTTLMQRSEQQISRLSRSIEKRNNQTSTSPDIAGVFTGVQSLVATCKQELSEESNAKLESLNRIFDAKLKNIESRTDTLQSRLSKNAAQFSAKTSTRDKQGFQEIDERMKELNTMVERAETVFQRKLLNLLKSEDNPPSKTARPKLLRSTSVFNHRTHRKMTSEDDPDSGQPSSSVSGRRRPSIAKSKKLGGRRPRKASIGSGPPSVRMPATSSIQSYERRSSQPVRTNGFSGKPALMRMQTAPNSFRARTPPNNTRAGGRKFKVARNPSVRSQLSMDSGRPVLRRDSSCGVSRPWM
eukprot:934420_1